MPRGTGSTPILRSFEEKWDLSGGCVSGTGLIKGICRFAGMTIASVPGATGYVDTNYEAKADAPSNSLEMDANLSSCTWRVSTRCADDKDAFGKVRAIEDSSERLIKRLVDAFDEHMVLCVISDHTTSSVRGDHVSEPTEIVVWSPSPLYRPDCVTRFCEREFYKGSLHTLVGSDVMPLLLGVMQRTQKFGA